MVVVVVVGVVCTVPVEGEVPVVGDAVVGVVLGAVGDDVVDSVPGDVVGTDVVDVFSAELTPGCSLATTRPMSTVAPLAARTATRVRRRTRRFARCLLSREWRCLANVIADETPSSACHHKSRPASRSPQDFLWTVCEKTDHTKEDRDHTKEDREGCGSPEKPHP